MFCLTFPTPSQMLSPWCLENVNSCHTYRLNSSSNPSAEGFHRSSCESSHTLTDNSHPKGHMYCLSETVCLTYFIFVQIMKVHIASFGQFCSFRYTLFSFLRIHMLVWISFFLCSMFNHTSSFVCNHCIYITIHI